MDNSRKRGRPKKTLQVKQIKEQIVETNDIILHLKITMDEINNEHPKRIKKGKKVNNYNLQVIKFETPIIKSINGNILIDNPTNVVCWWCTYNFDTIPCFLPEKYVDGVFYVIGCFCSFNCAVSYNLNLNDYKTWERYSLINKMYNLIHKKNELIQMAPPRETLKKFGGTISIEEFRTTSLTCIKEFRLVFPPMVPIIPFIEERKHYLKNK